MKAVRGAKFMEGLPVGDRTARQQLVNGMPIERARAEMNLLPENSQARRLLAQEIRRVETRATEAQAASRVGAETAEGLRQDLARMYLQNVIGRSRTIDPSTGAELIDPIKFSSYLREKGSVFDELFRGEKKQLNDLLFVMERGKADLAPSVIDDIMNRNQPLAESLRGLKDMQAQRAAMDKNRFLTTLRDGDTGTIAKEVLRSKANITAAKNSLSPDAFEGVKDAAMGRILQQADIATTAGGEVKMTDDFVEAFRSGRLGDRLQGIINSYGDETLDELFGAGTAKSLNTIAADMIRTSNASIAGKGGLAAPQIALGLGMMSIIMNPLATLPTAVGYMAMSKALRDKRVLKALMASRQPNTVKQFLAGKFKTSDPMAQGLQAMNQIVAQALVQGGRGTAEQTRQETRAMEALAQRQAQETRQNEQVNQMLSDLGQVGQQAMQTVTAPVQALTQTPSAPSSAAGSQVSPILVPNPTTRATFGG
jgi:polyhydroxyalkanoate synthesis regulator phasin